MQNFIRDRLRDVVCVGVENDGFLLTKPKAVNTGLAQLRRLWFAPHVYKSANAQIFSHYESAEKLPRKRNIDRYREPQQRFDIPQTGLRVVQSGSRGTTFTLCFSIRQRVDRS